MQIIQFNQHNFKPVTIGQSLWLTSTDICKALGYSRDDSVSRIYDRNADEFSANMTQVIDINLTVNLTVRDKAPNRVRVFSLRGAHLIAMFAKTERAKAFRVWVLDLIEQRPVQSHPLISMVQAQKLSALVIKLSQQFGKSCQTIYSDLHREFGVSSYADLPAADYDRVISWLKVAYGAPLVLTGRTNFYALNFMCANLCEEVRSILPALRLFDAKQVARLEGLSQEVLVLSRHFKSSHALEFEQEKQRQMR